MKHTSRTGSRLFFIEFLIVLFFFLIISTVCLRLFAAAHKTSQEADALSFAQTYAASLAELVEAGNGTPDSILDCYPPAIHVSSDSSELIMLYFDQDFHICGENNASYSLVTSLFVDNYEKSGTITGYDKNQNIIYELPFSFHQPMTKKEVLS